MKRPNSRDYTRYPNYTPKMKTIDLMRYGKELEKYLNDLEKYCDYLEAKYTELIDDYNTFKQAYRQLEGTKTRTVYRHVKDGE